MSDNKYKLFRNYMVNELGISRDDIKEWTIQAIQETVEKELRGFDVKALADRFVGRLLDNSYDVKNWTRAAFNEIITTQLRQKLVMSVELKEPPSEKKSE